MNEHPILFSGEMVRAILAGHKTQTRRVMKPQPWDEFIPQVGRYCPSMTDKRTGEIYPGPEIFGASDEEEGFRCPYGEPGARLWVRETFTAHGAFGTDGRIAYRADASGGKEPHGLNWKPSIFMPRKASRITLEIVGVRVERLQDISERDAIAEGVERDAMCGPCSWYQMIWEKINGKGSWAKNSFVWVLEFKRI